MGPGRRRRVRAVRHGDVTDPDGLAGEAGVERDSFGVFLCSCALVLRREPARVVVHWPDFLEPGGSMVIDVGQEHRAGGIGSRKSHL